MASRCASPLTSFNVAASSSEPSTADADVTIAGSGDSRTVALRADRNASSPGRVYTITVSATDAAGNSASASATYRVPHDLGK
jgi:hypothetical protein